MLIYPVYAALFDFRAPCPQTKILIFQGTNNEQMGRLDMMSKDFDDFVKGSRDQMYRETLLLL